MIEPEVMIYKETGSNVCVNNARQRIANDDKGTFTTNDIFRPIMDFDIYSS